MDGDVDISVIGALLADRSRCRVLAALGDGRALSASVLAAEAGVAASTASEHLAKLVEAGLLSVEPHGRHRYFRISGPAVADLLEAMAALAPAEQVRSLRAGTRAEALRFARTCYDHLAGRVGVGVMDALVARGHVEQDAIGDGPPDRLSSPGRAMRYGLTGTGAAFVEQLGLDLDDLAPRRMAVGYCIDWSEQRPHLSGSVGAALTTWFFDAGWIERAPTTRAVRITDAGLTGFAGTFGVDATRERS